MINMEKGTMVHCDWFTSCFEWTIEDFSVIQHDTALGIIKSRSFDAGDYSWHLKLYPHGRNSNSEGEFVSLYVYQETECTNVYVHFTVSIVNMFDVSSNSFSDQKMFTSTSDLHGCSNFIKRTELKAKGLLIDDILRIRCRLIIGTFLPKYSVSIKLVQDTDDLQKLLRVNDLSHVDFDVTVSVKSREFSAHRFVLCAQSEVFAGMFRHNMKEASSNVVTIDDCEPAVFKEFLRFLYSKCVRKLTCTEYQELYACADKYSVAELKPVCEREIKNEMMSIGNVVDILLFADMYGLASLKIASLIFISRMPSEVAVNSGWKKLHSEPELMEEVINSLASRITANK